MYVMPMFILGMNHLKKIMYLHLLYSIKNYDTKRKPFQTIFISPCEKLSCNCCLQLHMGGSQQTINKQNSSSPRKAMIIKPPSNNTTTISTAMTCIVTNYRTYFSMRDAQAHYTWHSDFPNTNYNASFGEVGTTGQSSDTTEGVNWPFWLLLDAFGVTGGNTWVG